MKELVVVMKAALILVIKWDVKMQTVYGQTRYMITPQLKIHHGTVRDLLPPMEWKM